MQRADVQTALFGSVNVASLLNAAELPDLATTAVVAAAALLAVARAYDSERKKRSRVYFRRVDLLLPSESPWAQLLRAGTDSGFLYAFMVDIATFRLLIRAADPMLTARADGWADVERSVPLTGRPRNNDSRALIAIALRYLQSPCGLKDLEIFFGSGHSVTDRDLNLGLDILLSALGNLPDETEVRWPTHSEQVYYYRLIENKYGPTPVPGVYPFCFADGLRKQIFNPSDAMTQRSFYNGYPGHTNTLQIFAFAPTGKIIFAYVGMPGSWNDYRASRPFFNLMRTETTPGFVAVADKGFSSKVTNTFMASERFVFPEGTTRDTYKRRRFESWRGAIRKSAEFGLNTMCSNWRRLSRLLPKEESQRNRMWKAIIGLHNLGAHRIPFHNQIKTMYALN